MAKKTPWVSSQVIAANADWRLSCNVSGFGFITWILRKKRDAQGRESGYMESYADEVLAFAACETRGLKIEVKKQC